MITTDIPYRYAKALDLLSKNPEEAASRSDLLQSLSDALTNNKTAILLFKSPKISIETKINVLDHVLKGSDDKTLKRFLKTLLTNRRFSLLPSIAAYYKKMVDHKRDIVTGYLSSYSPLSQPLLDRLKTTLERKLQKKVEIVETIDPRLLGGGILSIDNKLLDFSLSGKLSRLKNHLTAKRI